MPRNRKGSRRERELATRLDEAGFAVLRAPASGSATERELPDVLAGDGTHTYAIEAKASGGDPIYLDEAEVEALQHFADAFGAKPGRVTHPEWFRERHELNAPEQKTFDAFGDDDVESLDDLLEQAIQEPEVSA